MVPKDCLSSSGGCSAERSWGTEGDVLFSLFVHGLDDRRRRPIRYLFEHFGFPHRLHDLGPSVHQTSWYAAVRSTNLRLQIGVPKAGKEHRHVGNTYVHGTSSPGEKKMSSFPHLRLRTANSHGQATARHQRRMT